MCVCVRIVCTNARTLFYICVVCVMYSGKIWPQNSETMRPVNILFLSLFVFRQMEILNESIVFSPLLIHFASVGVDRPIISQLAIGLR